MSKTRQPVPLKHKQTQKFVPLKQDPDHHLNHQLAASPHPSPDVWIEKVIQIHGIDGAIRLLRPLTVPMFIGRSKENEVNPSFAFFYQASRILKKMTARSAAV